MKIRFIVLILVSVLTSCIPYRAFINGQPHIGEEAIFPLQVFPASSTPYLLPTHLHPIENKDAFNEFLYKHATISFLMIQQDTIVIEYYARPEFKYQPTETFSISKSFVAATIGIALEEGYLTNVNDTLGKYLPSLPESYHNIHIIDLLNMRSGIKTTFRNTIQIYYSNHLNQTIRHFPITSPSGREYKYSNQATQLLISLLEQSTHQNFSDYFIEKLWTPLKMEHLGYWSLDSRKYHTVRGFAGLIMTARDIAKLGLLYLHDGCLNNQQIIPASWIKTTLAPSETERITPEQYYHIHWKILTRGEEFLAKGLFGQYLYINKRTHTIIVRLGVKETSTNWIELFRKLADK